MAVEHLNHRGGVTEDLNFTFLVGFQSVSVLTVTGSWPPYRTVKMVPSSFLCGVRDMDGLHANIILGGTWIPFMFLIQCVLGGKSYHFSGQHPLILLILWPS